MFARCAVLFLTSLALCSAQEQPKLFRKPTVRRTHIVFSYAIGPLVGKRTWGGLVGHYTTAGDLIDDGFVASPNLAFYTPEGEWEIENHGVAPDFDELDPKLWRQGHDAQLEKAVQVVMDLLEKHPAPPHKRPPFPNYHAKEK